MTYVTENTQWLSKDITPEAKTVVARFYELADSRQSDAGHLMASEVFTQDAVLVSPNGTFQGFNEISKSRDNAWAVVNSRKHTISKVFLGQAEAIELILLGTVLTGFSNGKSIDAPFAAHVKVTSSSNTEAPLLSYMEVFADTKPIAAALAS